MNYFNVKLHNTTVRREIMAGLSTFISMSYILSMNPKILSWIGLDYDGVFIGTIVSSVLVMLVSACYTKMPLAYAPAVSHSIIFLPMMSKMADGDWRLMLLATYLSGVAIIIIVITGMYEQIIQTIPQFIRYSMVAGIGVAVAITGTSTLHIVEKLEGSWSLSLLKKEVVYCMIALAIIFILKKRKKRYVITEAVVITYVIIILAQTGISSYQHGFSLQRMAETFPLKLIDLRSFYKVAYQFPSINIFAGHLDKLVELLVMTFAMTITHFFDAEGTGTVAMEEIRKKDPNFDEKAAKRSMVVNGMGALISGCAGTSSVTTYGESMVGIDAGARTGLSVIVISICFALSLFIAPFYKMMSGYIVAPAMLYVGYLFICKWKKAQFQNVCEKISGSFIVLYTGLTFEVGYAVVWGMSLYLLLQLLAGRRKEITKYWPWILLLGGISAAIKWYS